MQRGGFTSAPVGRGSVGCRQSPRSQNRTQPPLRPAAIVMSPPENSTVDTTPRAFSGGESERSGVSSSSSMDHSITLRSTPPDAMRVPCADTLTAETPPGWAPACETSRGTVGRTLTEVVQSEPFWHATTTRLCGSVARQSGYIARSSEQACTTLVTHIHEKPVRANDAAEILPRMRPKSSLTWQDPNNLTCAREFAPSSGQILPRRGGERGHSLGLVLL